MLTRRGWFQRVCGGVCLGVCRAWLAALAATATGAGFAAAPAPAPATPVRADELILQFRHAELQAALRRAGAEPAQRAAVQRALDALGQRHGVALHYLQTLGVGSARLAMTPAAADVAALDARVARLAADAEVLAVEVNARMAHFQPGQR